MSQQYSRFVKIHKESGADAMKAAIENEAQRKGSGAIISLLTDIIVQVELMRAEGAETRKAMQSIDNQLAVFDIPVVNKAVEDIFVADSVLIDATAAVSPRQGLRDIEYWEDGTAFRWTGAKGPDVEFLLPIDRKIDRTLLIEFLPLGPLAKSPPAEFICFVDGKQVTLKSSLEGGLLLCSTKLEKETQLRLTQVNLQTPLWSPKDVAKDSKDDRTLGLAFVAISVK